MLIKNEWLFFSIYPNVLYDFLIFDQKYVILPFLRFSIFILIRESKPFSQSECKLAKLVYFVSTNQKTQTGLAQNLDCTAPKFVVHVCFATKTNQPAM